MSSSCRACCWPAWIRIIYLRSSRFGIGTRILRSNRLNAAMSSSHGMLVVAKTLTFSLILRIWSIYLRNSVFILRSVSLSLLVLLLPNESISSIKMIDGAHSIASSKRSMSLVSLSPMYFEVRSLTLIQKQVASEYWATAYVSIVLPTPGGPYNRIDCQGLTFDCLKISGHWFGTTNDILMHSLAYSQPAISSKVTSGFLVKMHFRREFLSSAL